MVGHPPDEFTVYSGPESIAPTTAHEGTNASRFAIAGALGSHASPRLAGTAPVAPEHLAEFGFNARLLAHVERERAEPRNVLYREASYMVESNRAGERGFSSDTARDRAWSELALEASPTARLMLLVAGVGSRLERESVVASVALVRLLGDRRDSRRHPFFWDFPHRWMRHSLEAWDWPWGPMGVGWLSPEEVEDGVRAGARWDGEAWHWFVDEVVADLLRIGEPDMVLEGMWWLAMVRVGQAERSADPVVREFAAVVRIADGDDEPEASEVAGLPREGRNALTSAMVHGTWGWRGDWWYPGGEFHSYVKECLRPQLYGGGMEFSWSGAFSVEQRDLAGERFARWVLGVSPVDGLGTVFAHSYGAEVACRAVNCGAPVDELVFLSAPVNAHHVAALDRVSRVVDVRLNFDIVLQLTGDAQRLPPHPAVAEHVLRKASWRHGATHSREVWECERIADQVGL